MLHVSETEARFTMCLVLKEKLKNIFIWPHSRFFDIFRFLFSCCWRVWVDKKSYFLTALVGKNDKERDSVTRTCFSTPPSSSPFSSILRYTNCLFWHWIRSVISKDFLLSDIHNIFSELKKIRVSRGIGSCDLYEQWCM